MRPESESTIASSLAKHGNQILYSTHAPVFLSVDRLEELALVRHHPNRGTTLFQPEALEEAEAFRRIRAIAGRRRTVVLAPDFEAVSGVSARGRGRKPRKAYRRYSGNEKCRRSSVSRSRRC
jgi:hypothetical protein